MKKKKTVKTRMLSLFLVLLLLTGSVSSVHAEEAAGTEAAGSETTKEQIVESEESVGSGEQGSVPGSAESTEAGQNAEGNTDAEKSDGTTTAKKDEEASSDKNASNQSAVKKEEKAKAASDEDKTEASGAGESEENKAKTGVGLTATLRVDGYGKSVLYPTNVTLPDTYKPLVGEDGYGFTEAQVGKDPGYYTPLHLMAQYCVDKGITPTDAKNGINIKKGSLSEFLGFEAQENNSFMFAVNNGSPNDGQGNLYSLANCPLSGGDNIVVYDWYLSENSSYVYFTEENMNVNAGTAFTVTLLSNDGMGYTAGPCQGADILVQQESGASLSEDDYVIKDKTDENGSTKVTINKTGTYLLTAERKDLNGYHELNRPFAKVKVDEAVVMEDSEVTTNNVKQVVSSDQLSKLSNSWESHLGKEDNNSVTDIKTPIKNGELLWQSSNKGDALWGNPGYPIFVNGKLYIARNSKLQIIDPATGKIEKSESLYKETKAWEYMYLTYGEGKIFVQLPNGSVQCFDAEKLESLFVTRTPEGANYGQNSIHYKNGIIYVGYSDGGVLGQSKGGFAAYKTVDSDQGNKYEEVEPLWEYVEGSQGFYGTSAITVERKGNSYIVAGGDGGKMLSFDPVSGEVKGELQLQGGIRCAVVEAEGYIWTTSYDSKNAGYLYKLAIDAEGKMTKSEEISLPSKSNSSPVVVGGKVYVTGGSQKGFFAVYDTDLNLLNSIETEGQLNTPTVTTAYEDSYVYFTENREPGSLYVAKVTKDNKITISTLYAPDGKDSQNYGMSNVVIGPDGTIYYGNDSSYLFAIRGELGEVPEKPDGGTDPDGGDGGKDDGADGKDDGNNEGSANDNTTGTPPSLKPDKKPTTTVSAQSFAPRKRTVKVNAATKNNVSSESNIVNAIQQSYDKKENSLTIKNPPEVVGAEVFKQLARYPEFRLVFDCGAYTLSMKGSDITNVNATLTMKLLEMENTLSEEDAARYGNYQRLMFAQEGPLPGKITVVYKLGEQFEQSEALYLYDLLGNTEAQEVILQKPYGMFVLENGGEFILSDQKVEEAQEAEVVEISEEIKPVNEKTTGIPVWIYLFIGLGAGALISGLITVKVMNARKRKDTWEK